MNALLWCFLSFRGELNRHQFALATLALLLLFFLVSRMGTDMFVGITDSNGGWTPHELHHAAVEGTALAAMLRIWPTLALQAKRVRNIGFPVRYLVGAHVAISAMLFIAPGYSLGMNAALFLYLMFAKGNSAPIFNGKLR